MRRIVDMGLPGWCKLVSAVREEADLIRETPTVLSSAFDVPQTD